MGGREFEVGATQVVSARQLVPQQVCLRLEVVEGPDLGLRLNATSPVVRIGTQAGSDLQLSDTAVSRLHLELSICERGIVVRDLDSTNGTYAAGIGLLEATISSGQVISLGRTRVRIEATKLNTTAKRPQPSDFGQMIGGGPAMRAVFELLARVAPTDETVLITGETGTGKELCARSIAAASRRASGPWVVVDCGAIPASVLESELFGHARGAFTGAVAEHVGAFERAHGGTVFLDEIGELPLAAQTRLLRVLDSRTVRRIGGVAEIPLDLRVLAATNRRLEEAVNAGTFRADLFYRLSVVRVRLPPLRQRPEDIEPLSRAILSELGAPHPLADPPFDRLRGYRWPGNVRELNNYLRRYVLGSAAVPGEELSQNNDTTSAAHPFKEAKRAIVDKFERDYLQSLLRRTRGNLSAAAREAHIDRTYISRLVQKHHLGKPSIDDSQPSAQCAHADDEITGD